MFYIPSLDQPSNLKNKIKAGNGTEECVDIVSRYPEIGSNAGCMSRNRLVILGVLSHPFPRGSVCGLLEVLK